MPPPRLLPIILAVCACVVWDAAAVAAEASPEPATTPPAGPNAAAMAPIEFFLAHGEPDACGPGCREWIAAEGKIDAQAAWHLRQLLAKLNGRQPPIYFHSPGGLVSGSIELGRLIRQQGLTVSVGRTLPLGCDRDKPLEDSCAALKRSGQEVEATLDPMMGMCNSGCVYALAGGVVRLIPPWVRIGIHDVGIDQTKNPPRGALLAQARLVAYARIRAYLHDMGVDETLLTAAVATPFNSVKPLQRDDIVRFGIDRREFGETAWQSVDKPAPSIRKAFFVRTDGDQSHYLDALLSMDCGFGLAMHVAFARQYLAVEPPSPPGQTAISINGKPIRLARGGSLNFYVRSTNVAMNTFDAVEDAATIVVPGTELARKDSVTLDMDGFSAAYAKLRKACPEAGRIAQAKALLKNPTAGSQILTAIGYPPAAHPAAIWQNPPAAPPPAAHPTAISQSPPAGPPGGPHTLEFTRVVAAEQKLRVDFFYDIQPDCSSAGQTTIRILEQPQHGTLTIENGQAFTNFQKDNQRYDCNTRKSDGTLVFYQPNGDYSGADSITLYAIFPFGAAQTRHYAIDVK
jgi:hypothetical protein